MRTKKRSGKVWPILVRLFCVAFIAMCSQGAEVIFYLRNGDRVSGKIVSETATEATIQSGLFGKITIPVGEILKREEIGPAAAAPASFAMSSVSFLPATS